MKTAHDAISHLAQVTDQLPMSRSGHQMLIQLLDNAKRLADETVAKEQIAKIETWQEAFEKQRSEADRIRTETDRDLKTRVSKIEDGINEILKYQRNKP
jgi:hypothetical protein